MRWFVTAIVVLLALAFLMIAWSEGILPDKSQFEVAAYVLFALIGVAFVVFGRRRKGPGDSGRPSSRGAVAGFIRTVFWGLGAHWIALLLGAVAFLVYMAANPLPRFARQDVLESRYATQIEQVRQFSQKTGKVTGLNCYELAINTPELQARPEIVEVFLEFSNPLCTATVYRGNKPEPISMFCMADPVGPNGQMPTVTIWDFDYEGGVHERVVGYTQRVRNTAGKEVEFRIFFDFDALRKIQSH